MARRIKELLHFENAHSGLAFRQALYGPDEDAALITDCLALANADVKGPRYLYLGVRDVVGGSRECCGVDARALIDFKRRLDAILARYVEPRLAPTLRALKLDSVVIGVVCFEACEQAPYLLRQALGGDLPVGAGFIRRGSRTLRLQRADLQKMFKREVEAQAPAAAVRVGFPGKTPRDRLALSALGTGKLPSEVAAERLRAMLQAKQQTREVLGRTETRMLALMHAKLYGADAHFEKQSDQSIRRSLEGVASDYRDADDHYLYEVRAHKLNLMVVNEGQVDLHRVALDLTLSRIEGIGVADRVYAQFGEEIESNGYPQVVTGPHTIKIRTEIGTLSSGRTTRAFGEPARLWLREAAAGNALAIDYVVRADDLEDPVRGTLVLSIEAASLKGV